MRTTPARLLILLALVLVIAVEARTALAFVDVELSVLQTAIIAAVLAGLVVAWALWPQET